MQSLANVLLLTFGVMLIVTFLVIFVVYYKKKQQEQQARLQEIRAEMQRRLLENSLAVQEEVRRSVAKDLHDEVGAMLSATRMSYMQLAKRTNAEAAHQEQHQNTKSLLDDTIGTVRKISKELVPTTLQNFGLVAALEDFFHRIEVSAQLPCILHHNFTPDFRFNSNQELMVYRIVQELTNNALKHAKASKLELSLLHTDNLLEVTFSDDGQGFDVKEAEGKRTSGLGLDNIKSRVQVANGSYQLHSTRGVGTRYQFIIPLENSI